jgi:ABC-type transporter Mla maintaining outer membrane lipid asymmetry ATPase subunit MlaF
LVNLITGASLPDQGEVVVLGQRTSDIAGGDEWLASLDRFGIVSPRGVLLESATVEQNLAMPLTLQIDPVPADVAARVGELARAVGLAGNEISGSENWLRKPAGETPPRIRARVHLARAVALSPPLLVLEHPGADLEPGERLELADVVAAVTGAGAVSTVVITNDDEFAKRVAHRALRLQPATGTLTRIKRGWFR